MKDNKAFSCIGILFVMFLVIVISTVLSGFVIQIMWGWFVTPLFGILPPTVAQAIGLSLFVGLFRAVENRGQGTDDGTPKTEKILTGIFVAVVNPLVYLALGYVIALFL
jgi:hypothetical protein